MRVSLDAEQCERPCPVVVQPERFARLGHPPQEDGPGDGPGAGGFYFVSVLPACSDAGGKKGMSNPRVFAE